MNLKQIRSEWDRALVSGGSLVISGKMFPHLLSYAETLEAEVERLRGRPPTVIATDCPGCGWSEGLP